MKKKYGREYKYDHLFGRECVFVGNLESFFIIRFAHSKKSRTFAKVNNYL